MSGREYTPDVWVVVEFTGSDVGEPYRRVLGGWYGGWGGSNSWKMSSGITETVEHTDHWEFRNASGSVYRCGKAVERYSIQTWGIFSSYAAQNGPACTVTRIPYGPEA